MEFQELIEKRRSVRKYSAGHRYPKEHIMEMIQAAQEAPSWKNSQTGRYYCLLSEEMTRQFRADCLPSGNALKSENATLIVTTFVRNRSGFKQNGTADNELENGWGCYDLGLQNANLVLKAEELGYGTLINRHTGCPENKRISFCSRGRNHCFRDCRRHTCRGA